MAASGVTVGDECVTSYNDLKLKVCMLLLKVLKYRLIKALEGKFPI